MVRFKETQRAFAAATLLNIIFVVVEAGCGILGDSLALRGKE